MKKSIFRLLILSTFILNLFSSSAFAISAAEKSAQDYGFTLSLIRDLNIIIENFGTDENRKALAEIKAAFKKSAEKHYAQEFQRPVSLTDEVKSDNNAQYSTEMFYQLKIRIFQLFDDISLKYIGRSQQILDSTAIETNNILIEYGRNSGLYKYFYRPIDPLTEIKPYNPANYHFFRDKETLERYLKKGYKSLQDAQNLYSNADYKYIKEKKNKTAEHLDFLLESNVRIMRHCRQAKQYGLEIHKMLKESSLVQIQKKYNVDLGTINRYPIYDDRIPEDFKQDAIDNQKLLFKLEKERLGMGAPGKPQIK